MPKIEQVAIDLPETQKLTPEQIQNWRKVLVSMFGVAAFGFSDAQIQAFRNRMQEQVDKMAIGEPK